MLMKESLSGNCKTTLIVTIAESVHMMGESASSLRFGLQCGCITKRVSQQSTGDIDKMTGKLAKRLCDLNGELKMLEQSGAKGGINYADHPTPTIDGFILNFKKLQSFESKLQSLKLSGGSKDEKHEAKQNVIIYQGIVMR